MKNNLQIVKRSYWINRIESAWRERNLIWLSGVRRSGKTMLCQSLEKVEYFDCELPRVRRQMSDPEEFIGLLKGRRIALDEIHRLENPSEILKIAADHFPETKVIATGSSTLGASAKFKDTLAGRKRDIWLSPMILEDWAAFENHGWDHRFIRGGLPPFYLAKQYPERDYQEWMDAYWAKDIQELFRVERRAPFFRFFELLVQQSGGIFQASSLAGPVGASRPTLSNYLQILNETYVFFVLKPFFKYRTKEIISAPKVYCFDTGFVVYERGWSEIREEDRGLLWEHFVLNQLCAHGWKDRLRYWRDKQKREVDFVLLRRGKPPCAIEAKWKADPGDTGNLHAFHRSHPETDKIILAHDVDRTFTRKSKGMRVRFMNLSALIKWL